MQSARQSIKPFLVIGIPDDQGRQRGRMKAREVASRPSTPRLPFTPASRYLASSAIYSFKYREYNPETSDWREEVGLRRRSSPRARKGGERRGHARVQMNRWTTVDPSGFPDGANNRVYAATPTSEFDPNGFAVYWITKEDNPNDPNPTLENLGSVTFSWSISDNGNVVSSGSTNADYNTAVANPSRIGYYTGRQPNSGIQAFGNTFSLTLVSKINGSWAPNGWSVSSTFLQNVGGVNYSAANAWLNPIGASTSSSTVVGLSSLLYSSLINDNAGYNGDLYYE